MEQFFFSSMYFELMNQFPEAERIDFLKAVIFYGVKREKIYSNNPVVAAVMANLERQIECAKGKHFQNQHRGKYGGRPQEVDRLMISYFRNEGYTTKEIAQIMDCSTRTVQRARKIEEINLFMDRTPKRGKTNYRPIKWDVAEELKKQKDNREKKLYKNGIKGIF